MLGQARLRNPWSIARARRTLDSLLRQGEYSAVICHMEWTHALFGPVAHRRGVPRAFWLHNIPTGKGMVERMARRVRAELVICNSNCTSSGAAGLFCGTDFRVLYYPVHLGSLKDDSDRAALRVQLDTPLDAVVLLQMSRLDKWKGHGILLEALARLNDDPNWVCWIAGGPQRRKEVRYFEKLKEKAFDLKLGSRVRFLGERTDIGRLLNAADIHCQANTGPESFGIVFIEALDAGLPVVTSAIGGALEIVDSSCGVLVPPEDPISLAAALGRLVKNPQERLALGSQGPARAEKLCDPQTALRELGILLATLTTHRVGELSTGQLQTVNS